LAFAERDSPDSVLIAAAVSADAHTVPESSRGVSDPSPRTLTPTPESITGRSRHGCVSEIVPWFVDTNATNDRRSICSHMHATIGRAIRQDSPSIVS
jgi:hypothetical protein